MADLRIGTYGSYYGSTWGTSEHLSTSEMEANVTYIYKYLSAKGWTKNAVCALCGNMQAESSINPGRWQSEDIGNMSMGYGLVQWTPATKYINWCSEQGFSDPSEMDNNLARIVYEVEQNIQWIYSGMTFKEFSTSTKSVEELATLFLLKYERPADQSESVQAYRGSLARNWLNHLEGVEPSEPSEPDTPVEPGTIKKKKLSKLLMYAVATD